MLGVDHDKIILLSTPFPTIPMLGKHCCCGVIVLYVGNKRCCIVLYCIVLYCIVLYCIVLYCIVVCERRTGNLTLCLWVYRTVSNNYLHKVMTWNTYQCDKSPVVVVKA